MTDKKEVPISIQLATGLTAVIPQNVDLKEKENAKYGEKWHKIVNLIDKIQDYVDSTTELSLPENVSIARGVHELLQTTALDDKSSLFHQEIDSILKRVEEEKWDTHKLGLHLTLLASDYDMDYEELTQELTKRRLVSYGITSIPQGHFSFDSENTTNVHLIYFTNMRLISSDVDLTIEMNPVYDGGIDSIAHPINKTRILLSMEKPIDIEMGIFLLRSNDLTKELRKHDEIIIFLKKNLARVVNRYATDKKGFWDERRGNSNIKDNTAFEDELFDFIEKDYLKKKLDSVQYRQFEQKLKYIDSDEMSGVTSLKAIAENILDDESYLRTGYYAKNDPQDLRQIVEKTKTALESLGCKIENNVFINFFEIIDKAAKNSKFANKINALWQSIFSEGNDKILVMMMKDDVESWTYLYWIDVHSAIFQKALETARGIVVINN